MAAQLTGRQPSFVLLRKDIDGWARHRAVRTTYDLSEEERQELWECFQALTESKEYHGEHAAELDWTCLVKAADAVLGAGKYSIPKLKEAVNQCDLNHNGKLSWFEFRAYMSRNWSASKTADDLINAQESEDMITINGHVRLVDLCQHYRRRLIMERVLKGLPLGFTQAKSSHFEPEHSPPHKQPSRSQLQLTGVEQLELAPESDSERPSRGISLYDRVLPGTSFMRELGPRSSVTSGSPTSLTTDDDARTSASSIGGARINVPSSGGSGRLLGRGAAGSTSLRDRQYGARTSPSNPTSLAAQALAAPTFTTVGPTSPSPLPQPRLSSNEPLDVLSSPPLGRGATLRHVARRSSQPQAGELPWLMEPASPNSPNSQATWAAGGDSGPHQPVRRPPGKGPSNLSAHGMPARRRTVTDGSTSRSIGGASVGQASSGGALPSLTSKSATEGGAPTHGARRRSTDCNARVSFCAVKPQGGPTASAPGSHPQLLPSKPMPLDAAQLQGQPQQLVPHARSQADATSARLPQIASSSNNEAAAGFSSRVAQFFYRVLGKESSPASSLPQPAPPLGAAAGAATAAATARPQHVQRVVSFKEPARVLDVPTARSMDGGTLLHGALSRQPSQRAALEVAGDGAGVRVGLSKHLSQREPRRGSLELSGHAASTTSRGAVVVNKGFSQSSPLVGDQN